VLAECAEKLAAELLREGAPDLQVYGEEDVAQSRYLSEAVAAWRAGDDSACHLEAAAAAVIAEAEMAAEGGA
jgi:uncharacterized Zn-binding protein involved in type VI secretion